MVAIRVKASACEAPTRAKKKSSRETLASCVGRLEMLRATSGLRLNGRRFSTHTSRAYRELLAAQRQLFAEDSSSREAARLETRTNFVANANAPASQVPGMVQDARDAAVFIRHNVAQTVRNDSGNFGARYGPLAARWLAVNARRSPALIFPPAQSSTRDQSTLGRAPPRSRCPTAWRGRSADLKSAERLA